ncbi:hypothetical protein PV328_000963 [Microctonus aethiopoides]|uniref:HIT-type domain-containing protein n=1 Tax=Microctonus aethiopoides TaxID=144406 RepID=A0AA39KX30_9HYME|nr:hypothetical protein PV328_000963 [Microctonus aethiopoides]
MDLGSTSSTSIQTCQLCSSNPPKYTCPRCSISYCSIECYKSTSHLDCSEEFYKECVENEMKSQSYDSEDKKKMMEILKRFHAEQSNFDICNDDSIDDIFDDQNASYESIDSDDDDAVADLNKRIENVDLNNADELWSVLTDAEKQEFEAIIRNGEEDTLLPQWTPWWAKLIDKPIQILDECENETYKKNCPRIVEIVPMNAVEKASPSICYNLLNILNAYALTILHYNGEHESAAMEACIIFLELNDVIGGHKIFEDPPSAVTSVFKKAIDYELIPETSEQTVLLDSVKQIIQGPCKEHQTYYMAAALSDLHQLFTKVKSKFRDLNCQNSHPTFPQKFTKGIQSKYSTLTKKDLQLYIKKVEYYLAWLSKYGERMYELNLEL